MNKIIRDNMKKFIIATLQMYDITNGKNELVDFTTDQQPINIITGMDMIQLPALEEKWASLSTGDDYELALTADKAFGEYDDNGIVDVDKSIFYVDGVFNSDIIYPGAIVPLQNEAGKTFGARVLEVTEDKVKIDFNHPYAGMDLLISGKIIESHPATDEEIMALTSTSCGGCGGSCGGGSSCGGSEGCGCGGGCGDSCSCGNNENYEEESAYDKEENNNDYNDGCCGGGCPHCVS
jgi:FKBP-type peptidyl-prolyl cis-trans isomerase SlyD